MAEAAVLEGNVEVAPESPAPIDEAVNEAAVADEEVDAPAEAAPEEAATPAPKWAGKTDEEIEAALEARGKDVEARTRQSERDRAQAEAIRSQRVAEQQYVQSGGVLNDMKALIKHSLDTGEDITPAHLQRVVNRTWSVLSQQNVQALSEMVSEAMPKGASIPVEKQAELDRLRDRVGMVDRQGKPLATLDELVASQLKTLVDVAIEARKPELKAEWEKERADTAKKRNELAGLKKADAERTGSMRPTTGNGALPSTVHVTAASLRSMTPQQIMKLTSTAEGQEAVNRALKG